LRSHTPQPFSICFADGVVLADWTGFPSAEAIRASYEETMAQPEFCDGMPILAIIHPQVPLPPSEYLRQIPVLIAPYARRTGPLALVVQSDIHMGLGRMLCSHCHMAGLQAEIFTTVEAAHVWLRNATEGQQQASAGGSAGA
jgi:hypothetical protein